MTSPMLEFWFDFSSGYAYFAAATIDEVAERHGRVATWRPYMLGVAFKQTGARGLSSTPMKGDYARRDWARLSRKTGLRFSPPQNHPIVALPTSRAFYWIEKNHPELANSYAKAAFKAYFADAADLTDPARAAALGENLGLPRAKLEAGIKSDWVKARFKDVCDEALAKGVFGSPFFIADGEPFWGWDRIPMLDEWLATGGW